MSLEEVDTPALVVDAGVVRANVAAMAATAREAGVALRPHAKTHKMLEVAGAQLAAGAAGLTVAKLGEADVFVDGGCTDVLIAYPLVGAAKLDRLVALAERADVAVALDGVEVAEAISAAARRRGVTIGVRVEVDTGLHRVGVQPDAALALARAVAALGGLRLEGVMTHEGHAYGAADLAASARAACAAMVAIGEAMRADGLDAPVVSLGSTPTAPLAAGHPGVTEVRPGTYVFNDRTQVAHGAAREADVAATVLATVVSRPAPGRAVVDAGTKALTSDRLNAPGAPVDFGAVAGTGWPVVRASEEHGVLAVPPDAALAVGDRVALVPNHICPVVNLFDEAVVVEDGRVIGRWAVAARGRTK
jgi:D-serine deaminase-like pyridoxal phosphate-dependent protein